MFPHTRLDFTHRMIQDYFAGSWLFRENNYELGPSFIERVYFSCQDPLPLLVGICNAGDDDMIRSLFTAPLLPDRDKLPLFEFLVCRLGPDTPLLAELADTEDLPRLFFDTGYFYRHLDFRHEKLVRALFGFARTPELISRFAACLFLSAVLQWDICSAETWLREFRQTGHHGVYHPHQDAIMQSLLDWLRYQKKPAGLQEMVSATLAAAAPEPLHLLLLSHLLIYLGEYRLLLQTIEVLDPYHDPLGDAFRPIKELVQKMGVYASFMSGVPFIVSGASSTGMAPTPACVLDELILARTGMACGNYREAVRYAEKANASAATLRLRGYQLLAYELLEEAYRHLARPTLKLHAQRAALEIRNLRAVG